MTVKPSGWVGNSLYFDMFTTIIITVCSITQWVHSSYKLNQFIYTSLPVKRSNIERAFKQGDTLYEHISYWIKEKRFDG